MERPGAMGAEANMSLTTYSVKGCRPLRLIVLDKGQYQVGLYRKKTVRKQTVQLFTNNDQFEATSVYGSCEGCQC